MSRMNKQLHTYLVCLPTGNLAVRSRIDAVMTKRMFIDLFDDIEENAP